MNMQQVGQPRTSSNGHGRRKVERDSIARPDSKFQTGKSNSSGASIGKGVSSESPSRDRLIYLTTCLVGHQVEVHLMDGSVITGIFHATNAEDFGIVLKMAHLIRDGSGKQKNISDSLNKPPSRTLIIPANDLVQLIAKGVPVTKDGISNELPYERQQELLTDSCISQSRHIEVGRELGRWVPDENEPSFPDLENVFDSPWKRGWDQFETNATLFGVKSTFNEELYTTKLERGPQMRELEKEALRIAREIEGQDTLDLHLAEERGIQLNGNLEIDEETRFSSVFRPVDDSGYDEAEDIILDSQNDETFGDTSPVISKPLMNLRKTSDETDETRASSRSSLVGEVQSSVSSSRDVYRSSFEDQDQQLLNENFTKESSVIYASRVLDNQLTGRAKNSSAQEDKYKPVSLDRGGASKAENTDLLLRLNRDSSDEVATSPKATSFDPSHASSKVEVKVSSTNELPEGALPPKAQGAANSGARPSSSASSTSDRGGPASTSATRGSSRSSVGSLSSDKSYLNPHAKEFKFNPNAKSFVPSQTSLRPSSPVAEGPFFYPAMPPVTQMHGMPVGVGIGPSFAPQQHVIYNPQAAPAPPPYYHPNGPQYGQQMMIGQHRPVLYMPYSPEMAYNGREF